MALVTKLRTWMSTWDAVTWVAALLCVAPLVVLTLSSPQPSADAVQITFWEQVFQWALLPFAIVFLMPFVAATQVATFWMVQMTRRPWAKGVQLMIAAATLIPLYNFNATADLTSTSTAPLAGIFYPVYLAVFAVPTNFVLFLLSRKRSSAGERK